MDSLNLANCPSDVIRVVVANVGLLNIDDAKLISPRWNTIVLEHLADPNRRPAIKWFRWDSDEFGSAVTFLATQRESFSHSHSETLATRKVTRLLKRCSTISKIELTIANLEAIKGVLCNLPIGELTIADGETSELRNEGSRAITLDFLRACVENGHHVQQFISSSLFDPMNIHAEFLMQCAKLVAEVVVVRKDNEPFPRDLNFILPLTLSCHLSCLRDTLNGTQQVYAQLTTESNGWNEIYRLAIKSLR